MKSTIQVTDKREADMIRVGLDDPETRACVQAMGVLLSLPSTRMRKRVLQFVADRLDEQPDGSSGDT